MTSDLKASMEFFLPSPPYYNEAPRLETAEFHYKDKYVHTLEQM